MVFEMGKLLESVMRTSPPDVTFGVWSIILWVNFSFDFLKATGVSSSIDPGVEPWNMYFSEVGMFLKTSGLTRKFSDSTALGVWAVRCQ